jgi:gluconate 2-dehydrogenase gamma chain
LHGGFAVVCDDSPVVDSETMDFPDGRKVAMKTPNWLSERRGFLKSIVGVSAAGLAGAVGILPDRHDEAHAAATDVQPYKPNYFNDAEWRFINAAVDRLIPSNEDGPGAVELQVPRFIDKQMDSEYGHGGFWYLHGPFAPDAVATLGYQQRYSPRDFYRTAIPGIDNWCRDQHGKAFADLDPLKQDAVLAALEEDKITLPTMKASAFFDQIIANTKEGYFADPMYGGNLNMGSWKMIGFPGARADFKDWVLQYDKPYPLGPVSIDGEKG